VGCISGDRCFKIKEKKHDRFFRKNDDILLDYHISLKEAVMGDFFIEVVRFLLSIQYTFFL
jgi:DnaJ-class molecular chaperone